MTAIAGTYADLKFIRTRRTAQVVIEIPIERAGEVVDLFGAPQPDAEVWVALARLNPEKVAGSSNGRTSDFGSEDAGSTPAPAAKRRFEEMPRSQQAGVLCNDERFQEWLKTICPTIWENAHRDLRYADDGGAVAGEAVRVLCDVGSRADLNDHPRAPAPMKWDRLVAEYRRSQRVDDDYLPERRG